VGQPDPRGWGTAAVSVHGGAGERNVYAAQSAFQVHDDERSQGGLFFFFL